MTTELLDTLALARAFLDEGWCRWYLARTENEQPTLPENPNAARWCLMGALSAAADHCLDGHPERWPLEEALARRLTFHSKRRFKATPISVNDLDGLGAVRELLDVVAAELGKG